MTPRAEIYPVNEGIAAHLELGAWMQSAIATSWDKWALHK